MIKAVLNVCTGTQECMQHSVRLQGMSSAAGAPCVRGCRYDPAYFPEFAKAH